MSEVTHYCSFCGKSQHGVGKLIAGPTVFICDECVELCNDIIFDAKVSKAFNTLLAEHLANHKPPILKRGFWASLFSSESAEGAPGNSAAEAA